MATLQNTPDGVKNVGYVIFDGFLLCEL